MTEEYKTSRRPQLDYIKGLFNEVTELYNTAPKPISKRQTDYLWDANLSLLEAGTGIDKLESLLDITYCKHEEWIRLYGRTHRLLSIAKDLIKSVELV